MGRRNTYSKPTPKAFRSYESFVSADSSGTPPWLGSDGVQPDRSIVLGEVLADQLTERCCIDRLSWHDLPGLSTLSKIDSASVRKRHKKNTPIAVSLFLTQTR